MSASASASNERRNVGSGAGSSGGANPNVSNFLSRHLSQAPLPTTSLTTEHTGASSSRTTLSTRDSTPQWHNWNKVKPATAYSSPPPSGYHSQMGSGLQIDQCFRPDAERPGDVLIRARAAPADEQGGSSLGAPEMAEFYCHRDILWFSSPFFRSVLAGDWKETNLAPSGMVAQQSGEGVEDDEDGGYSDVSDEDEGDEKAGKDEQDELASKRASVRASFHTANFSLEEPSSDDATSRDTLQPESPTMSHRFASLAKLATPPTSRRGSRSSLGRPVSVRSACGRRRTRKTRPTSPKRHRSAANASSKMVAPSYPHHRLSAVIDLPEDDAEILYAALCHVYPQLTPSITWRNAAALLRFTDKYDIAGLRRAVVEDFLQPSLAGRPCLALRIADEARLREIYKEASRHVLDNLQGWDAEELALLSPQTLLKLERKRTWFLERLLKLSLTLNPARDFLCQVHCPHPESCANLLHERWTTALAAATRFGPPTPSVVWRHLREMEVGPLGITAALACNYGVGGGLGGGAGGGSSSSGVGGGAGGSGSNAPYGREELAACHMAAKVWIQLLFDRMFELGGVIVAGSKGVMNPRFLTIKLDG